MARLAHELGVSGEDVWGDPANRELRDRREDMNVLLPGDTLRVPAPRRSSRALHAGGRECLLRDCPHGLDRPRRVRQRRAPRQRAVPHRGPRRGRGRAQHGRRRARRLRSAGACPRSEGLAPRGAHGHPVAHRAHGPPLRALGRAGEARQPGPPGSLSTDCPVLNNPRSGRDMAKSSSRAIGCRVRDPVGLLIPNGRSRPRNHGGGRRRP